MYKITNFDLTLLPRYVIISRKKAYLNKSTVIKQKNIEMFDVFIKIYLTVNI